MATIIKFQLSKDDNLAEIIFFHGLDHSMIIHPTLLGEPILTAQAFYYLEHLDPIASIRFENTSETPSDSQIEYLIDNYLFHLSLKYPEIKLSTKIDSYKLWQDDDYELRMGCDFRKTQSLILDSGNDDSIMKIEDPEGEQDFSDWCIVRNYSSPLLNEYIKELSKIINKKINIMVMPNEYHTGYFGKARVIECDYGLLSYHQAARLENIDSSDIKPGQQYFEIKNHSSSELSVKIPIIEIEANTKFNPTLLSYYFSGLRERNPLIAFSGFYNVLEYYFEEAPKALNKEAKFESQQIKLVIELITSNESIEDFFNRQSVNHKNALSKKIKTSSGVEIEGINNNTGNLIEEIGRWIYEIRCAIVHSKKTRKGNISSFFEPYTPEAENIRTTLPTMQWLASLLIQKDYELDTCQ